MSTNFFGRRMTSAEPPTAQSTTGAAKALFWVAYSQVTGVLGALGMIVFASHFIAFDLHGIVESLFSFWAGSVRPLVGLVLGATVEPIVRLVGLDFTVPMLVKDYLGAGFVLAFSFLRMMFVAGNVGSFWEIDLTGKVRALVATLILLPLIWPFMVIAFPLNLAWLTWKGNAPVGATKRTLLVLTPIIYVGVLFALNAALD